MAEKSNSQFESPFPIWFANSLPVKATAGIYSQIIHYRNSRYNKNKALSFQAQLPVISIGGIRAGGTGKTPAAMLIGELLTEKNREIVFLSRGYKKPNKGNFIARPGENVSWLDCGDEPAMLHHVLPYSWLGIGADRVSNAKAISKLIGKDGVFVLDDGFQHRKIKRDLDIVCLNETVFSDRLLPGGFLREPIESLKRAHIAFLIGTNQTLPALEEIRKKLSIGYPHLDSYILLQEIAGWVNVKTGIQTEKLPLERPVAMCGIARPERFFDTISNLGITPCEKNVFSDHHHFALNDFHKLYSKGIVMTEKDAIRLIDLKERIKSEMWYLKIRLKFHGESLNGFQKKLETFLNSF